MLLWVKIGIFQLLPKLRFQYLVIRSCDHPRIRNGVSEAMAFPTEFGKEGISHTLLILLKLTFFQNGVSEAMAFPNRVWERGY
jgi:hypothetical protein